jgi:hypothetical protein
MPMSIIVVKIISKFAWNQLTRNIIGRILVNR